MTLNFANEQVEFQNSPSLTSISLSTVPLRREDILRKAKEEREKRQRQRQEQLAANIIQKHWRAWLTLRSARSQFRSTWQSTFAPALTAASNDQLFALLQPSSPCLAQLLFFFSPENRTDAAALASLAERMLRLPPGLLVVLFRSSEAELGPAARQSLEIRFLGLRDICLACLDRPQCFSPPQFDAICRLLILLSSAESWRDRGELSGPAHALHTRLVSGPASVLRRRGPRAPHGASVLSTLAHHLLQSRAQMQTAAQPATPCEAVLLQHAPQLLEPALAQLGAGSDAGPVLALMSVPGLAALLPAGHASLLAAALHALRVAPWPLTPAPHAFWAPYSHLFLPTLLANVLGCERRLPPHPAPLPAFLHTLTRLLAAGALEGRGVEAPPAPRPADPAWLPQVDRALAVLGDRSFLQSLVDAAFPEDDDAAPSDAMDVDPPPPRATSGARTSTSASTSTSGEALCRFLYVAMKMPDTRGALRERVLRALGPSPRFVRAVWTHLLAAEPSAWEPGRRGITEAWCVFAAVLRLTLMVTGDPDLHEQGTPFPVADLKKIVAAVRDGLWTCLWNDASPPGGWPQAELDLRVAYRIELGRLFSLLYDRNKSRSFVPQTFFHAPALLAAPGRFSAEAETSQTLINFLLSKTDAADDEGPSGARGEGWRLAGAYQFLGTGTAQRPSAVLFHVPGLVPFEERARIFQSVVARDRAEYRERDAFAAAGFGRPAPVLRIRRDHILDDGLDGLSELAAQRGSMKGRIRVSFVSNLGLEEAGIDGGGLFKEFVDQFLRKACDSNLGLFAENHQRQLYPNPSSGSVLPEHLRLFEICGAMVAKALYEGILLEVPFARFFLKKVRAPGGMCDVNDLPSYDPQLYHSLLFLKGYQGDLRELGLTFAVEVEALGVRRQVELIPGGKDIPVTSESALRYIYVASHFYLNQRVQPQCSAFLRGFYSIIDRKWIEMFHDHEIQELLSGADSVLGAGLDLADLKRNVVCRGPAGAELPPEHALLKPLWKALAELTPEQQSSFLRFVTSASRPPLLGFSFLEPKISIYVLDEGTLGRLPTSATCLNLLKLPPYKDVKTLKAKLLTAISSGGGFELS